MSQQAERQSIWVKKNNEDNTDSGSWTMKPRHHGTAARWGENSDWQIQVMTPFEGWIFFFYDTHKEIWQKGNWLNWPHCGATINQ